MDENENELLEINPDEDINSSLEYNESFEKINKDITENYKNWFEDIKPFFYQKEPDRAIELTAACTKCYYNIHTIRSQRIETWVTIDGIENSNGETYVFELCRILWGEHYKKPYAQKVLDIINVDTLIESKDYFQEADPRYIPMLNTVYDVCTHTTIIPPKKVRFFNKIPIDYNPNATCPNFIKHLHEVLIDEKDIAQIQEIFGFCLYRRYTHEKAFMWIGDGRNGKGKTAEVLSTLLGSKNVTNVTISRLETYPFSLFELFGKYANIVGEMEQSEISAATIFKNTTGGDLVVANRKHKSTVEFRSYAKWIIMANEIPILKDQTFAFFNRINLISFPYTFIPKTEFDIISKKEILDRKYKLADEDHIKKLTTKEELQGIFNWSIEGLDRLQKNNGFTTSKTTLDTKHIILRKSNNFLAFKEELIERNWDKFISLKGLRYVYDLYAHKNNVSPVSNREINIVLRDNMGIQKSQKTICGNRVWVWDGITFNKDVEALLAWGEENGIKKPAEEEEDIRINRFI